MPIWLVKTTWREDETDASEQWVVNADTEQAAVDEINKYVRFRPQRIEASLQPTFSEDETELLPGQVRRLSP